MLIKKLDNQNRQVARRMQHVFQASYSVEAKILNVVDFPPLNRVLEEYRQADTVFFGFWMQNELAGVVEIRETENNTHIQSLVVDPQYFRQGIASKLMAFVLSSFNSDTMFVETGIDNMPAIRLYEKFSFKQVRQWDTDCGIRKVRLDYQK